MMDLIETTFRDRTYEVLSYDGLQPVYRALHRQKEAVRQTLERAIATRRAALVDGHDVWVAECDAEIVEARREADRNAARLEVIHHHCMPSWCR